MRYRIYRRIVGATLRQAVGGSSPLPHSPWSSPSPPQSQHRPSRNLASDRQVPAQQERLARNTAGPHRNDSGAVCLTGSGLLCYSRHSAASPPCSTIAIAIQGCIFLTATALAITADQALTDRDQRPPPTLSPTLSKAQWRPQPDLADHPRDARPAESTRHAHREDGHLGWCRDRRTARSRTSRPYHACRYSASNPRSRDHPETYPGIHSSPRRPLYHFRCTYSSAPGAWRRHTGRWRQVRNRPRELGEERVLAAGDFVPRPVLVRVVRQGPASQHAAGSALGL